MNIPRCLYRVLLLCKYKVLLKKIGWHSVIISPLRIDGGKRIVIGNKCHIGYKTWLASMPLTGGKESKLIIGDGCLIGHFNHIYATREIVIGNNVLTADKVYISDNIHGYEDITLPILSQPIAQRGAVEIGEGTWLGENVCVIGACIGKHCVIGCNSVVTKNIPDYSVAVGSPAKIIKKYNFDTNKWVRIYEEKTDRHNSGGGKTCIFDAYISAA